MKNRVYILAAAFLLGTTLLTGCGSPYAKVLAQADKDFENGSYNYALEGYESCILAGEEMISACRGAGMVHMKMGEYDAAVEEFTTALAQEKLSKKVKQDLLSYRACAYDLADHYEACVADCQTLFQEFGRSAETCFLNGKAVLGLNSYDEAESSFLEAYSLSSTYDMAIQIYEAYQEKDMEADGMGYLEKSLEIGASGADDYCSRGLINYYMGDYSTALDELITASDKGSKEAILLMGMVYQAQGEYSNARTLYTQYISENKANASGYNGLAMCDIAEENYSDALIQIENGIQTADNEELQDLLFNEMVVYEKQLDFETAVTKCRDYLAMYPDDAAAQKELSFLNSRLAG